MAYEPISGLPPQFSALADGTSASDYYLKFYAADGTTPINMATDTTGGTLLAKCKINSTGYTVNGSNAVFIPHIDQEYKLALYPSEALADANTLASATWVVDDIPARVSQGGAIVPFATVVAAQAATGLAAGMTICLADRASSLWDLASSGSANGYNVILLTTSGLYATLRDAAGFIAKSGGVSGDGSTNDAATFTALDAIYDEIRLTPGTYLIGTNTTIAADISFDVGAKFSISTGVTLTLNGQIQAGDMQEIFAGLGTVTLFGTVYSMNWYDTVAQAIRSAKASDSLLINKAMSFAGATIRQES